MSDHDPDVDEYRRGPPAAKVTFSTVRTAGVNAMLFSLVTPMVAERRCMMWHSMLDELVDAVSRNAKLPPEQASLAVTATLRYLTAHMPSPVVGALHDSLGQTEPPCGAGSASTPDGPNDADQQA